jgi:hypothetical protein
MINPVFYKSFFYAAAFLTGCCFVCSCENDPTEISKLTENVEMREEARDIVSFMSQDGQVKAKLTAPLMYRVTTDTSLRGIPELTALRVL